MTGHTLGAACKGKDRSAGRGKVSVGITDVDWKNRREVCRLDKSVHADWCKALDLLFLPSVLLARFENSSWSTAGSIDIASIPPLTRLTHLTHLTNLTYEVTRTKIICMGARI